MLNLKHLNMMQTVQSEQEITLQKEEETTTTQKIEQQAKQIRLALFLVSWMMGVLFVISSIAE